MIDSPHSDSNPPIRPTRPPDSTMIDIVFVNVKTTSLRPDRRAWEIATIKTDESQPCFPPLGLATEWMINREDLDLANADPQSLHSGGFYERHEQNKNPWELPHGPRADTVFPEKFVAECIEKKTRGVTLCGIDMHSDALTLDGMLRRHGLLPAWRHQLLCVRSMAIGWLLASQNLSLTYDELTDASSLALSRLCGVEPSSPGTAMGDLQWAVEWFFHLIPHG